MEREENDNIFKGRLETVHEYDFFGGKVQLKIKFNQVSDDFACLSDPSPHELLDSRDYVFLHFSEASKA